MEETSLPLKEFKKKVSGNFATPDKGGKLLPPP